MACRGVRSARSHPARRAGLRRHAEQPQGSLPELVRRGRDRRGRGGSDQCAQRPRLWLQPDRLLSRRRLACSDHGESFRTSREPHGYRRPAGTEALVRRIGDSGAVAQAGRCTQRQGIQPGPGSDEQPQSRLADAEPAVERPRQRAGAAVQGQRLEGAAGCFPHGPAVGCCRRALRMVERDGFRYGRWRYGGARVRWSGPSPGFRLDVYDFDQAVVDRRAAVQRLVAGRS